MKAHTPKRSAHQAPPPVSKEGHRHRSGYKFVVDEKTLDRAKHDAVPPRWEVRGLADFSIDELAVIQAKLDRWVHTGIGREQT